MSHQHTQVANNVVVAMAYALRLDSGELVDQSADDSPLQYLHGHQNIIPGLERALLGLRIGDTKQVEVSPADGYGEYDPDAKQIVPTSSFPPEFQLAKGMALRVRDDQGHIHQVIVDKLDSDSVQLDFNHPLAGKILYFDVEIVSLRSATPEEVAHGHVHTGEHGH